MFVALSDYLDVRISGLYVVYPVTETLSSVLVVSCGMDSHLLECCEVVTCFVTVVTNCSQDEFQFSTL